MVEIVLNSDIGKDKIEALLQFLKTWDVDAKLKHPLKKAKQREKFTLSAGIWEDHNVDAKTLRQQTWKCNK